MDWIRLRLEQNTHPLIELLNEFHTLSKTEDKSSYPFFLEHFPDFDKKTINSIESRLKSGTSIVEAFYQYIFSFKFDIEILRNIIDSFETSETVSQFYIDGVLLYTLTVIVDNRISNTPTLLHLICDIFHNKFLKNMTKIIYIEYIELCERYLGDENFDWDNESLISCGSFFPFFDDPIPSSVIFGLIKASHQSTTENGREILINSIIQVLIDKPTYFSKEDSFRMISLMDYSIKKLDPRALRLLAILSNTELLHPIKDDFVIISSVYINLIIQEPIQITQNDFIESSPIELKPSEFIFHSCQEHEFEMAFKQIKYDDIQTKKTFKNFLSPIMYEKVQALSESIETADVVCLDCFFTSFVKIITAYRNDPHIYDLIMNEVVLISHLASSTPILPLSEIFFSQIIFNPNITVFHENGASDVIKFLRGSSINTLASSSPTLLADLLVQNQLNPLLAAEIIAHFLYPDSHIDNSIFITEPCLQTISLIISALWSRFDDHKGVRLAFHTVMSFLFSLLNDAKNRDLIFSSVSFCETFLLLATESTLLNTVIVTIRNYLLETENDDISAVTKAFSNLYRHCSKINDKNPSQSLTVVKELGNMIIYVLSHCPKFGKNLKEPLDAMMEFALISLHESIAETSEIILQILKFFSIVTQSSPFYEFSPTHFSKLVKVIKRHISTENEKIILQNFINIVAGSNALTIESLYIIKVPSFLPVFVAAFGESPIIENVFDCFIKLCKYSPTNCRLMHESGIDLILIDYVSKKYDFLNFRGLNFKITRISNDTAFSLLWLITREKSSYQVCMEIMKLITEPPNKDLASRILSAQTSEASSRQKIEFQLGLIQPFAILEKAPSTLFNKKMTFCYWIKLDESLLSTESTSINILKINNELNQTFTLFLYRGTFFLSFTDPKDENNSVKVSVGQTNNNSWAFCALILQRVSLAKTIVGFYANSCLIHTSEVPAMMFDQDLPINIEFGGDGNNQISNNAILGPFGISSIMMTEENLQSVEKRGIEALNEKHFVLSTNLVKTLPCTIDLEIGSKVHFFYERAYQHSLHYMLGKGNHLYSIVRCFSEKYEAPDGFLEVLIGLIKTTISNYFKFQEKFHGFSLIGKNLENNHKVTYQLYIAFFNVMDSIENEQVILELFDGIIMNIKIWRRTKFFVRVINHWSHSAIPQYIQLIKRNGFYANLVMNFDMIYQENPNDTKLIQSFYNLLLNTGQLYISGKDFNQLFPLVSLRISCKEFSLMILELICEFAPKFVKSHNKVDRENALLNMITKTNDVDVTISIVKCLHNFSIPSSIDVLLTASLLINRHPEKAEIFTKLCSFATQFPGFYVLYSIMPLSLTYQHKELAAASLSLIATTDYVMADELWYVWPVLLAMYIKDEAFKLVVDFITHFATKEKVEEIIIVTKLIMSLLYIDKTDILINLFKIFDHNFTKEVAIYIYLAAFFRYTNLPYSYTLLEEFAHSEFNDAVAGVEIPDVRDLLTFNELLRGNFDDYTIRFGMSPAPRVLSTANKILGEYNLIAMSSIGKQVSEIIKRNITLDILSNFNIAELTTMFSLKYRGEFTKKINEINQTIANAKSRINSPFNMVSANSLKKDQDLLTPNAVEDYYSYMTCFDYKNCVIKKSDHTLCGFIPTLTSLNYVEDFEFTEEINLSDLDFSSKNFVSLPGNIIKFGEKEFAILFCSEVNFMIITRSRRITSFSNENIRCIFKRQPNSLEFILYENKSILIDFSPLSINDVVRNTDKINPVLCEIPIENVIIFNSNFERFAVSEFINGKSVHTLENEPLIDAVNYREFIGVGPDIVSKRIDIEDQFSNGLIKQSFLLHLKQSHIVHAAFFRDRLAIFMKNGDVNVYLLSASTMPELQNTFNDIFLDDSCVVVPGTNSLTIENRSNMTVTTIWDVITHSNVTKLHNHWCKDKDTPAWINSAGCISISNFDVFIPEKVTKFAFSQSSGILAASTDKCNIFIHSIFRYELFSYFHVDQLPDSLLVTDSGGFVILSDASQLKVYTANGSMVGIVDGCTGRFIKYVMKGLDYIAYTSSFIIKYFCVLDPSHQFIAGEVKSRVLDIAYLDEFKSLFLMCASAKVHMFPVNIK